MKPQKRLTKEEFLEKYKNVITEKNLKELSFDYFNENFPKGTRLPKTDLEFLYLTINLGRKEIAELIGCSESKVKASIDKYNLRKPIEKRNIVQERTCLRKYGFKSSAQNEIVKEKAHQTTLARYNVDNVAQLNESKEKAKQTCLQKYGVDNYCKTENFKQYLKDNHETLLSKSRATSQQKYQANSFIESKYMNHEKAIEKRTKTLLNNYGVTNIAFHKYSQEKKKQTCIKKYGYEYVLQVPQIKEKSKQTCKKKYNYEHAGQVPEFHKKARETAKERGSFKGMSKFEEYAYNKLITKFPQTDYLHYDEERYPFECDFYLPETDTFIEIQGYWVHGDYPFNPNCEEDLKIVKFWEERLAENHEAYANAINVWTLRDPLKRETAKKNNLNWIEFFTIEEFDEWFEKQESHL